MVRSKAKYPQIYDTIMGIVQGITAKRSSRMESEGNIKIFHLFWTILSATQSLIMS